MDYLEQPLATTQKVLNRKFTQISANFLMEKVEEI